MVRLPKRPKALPVGVVVTLVSEREMTRAVAEGRLVQRIVLERIAGDWRLLVFLKGHTDGITVGKYRGGWRRWKRMEKVLAYVQEMMPEYPVEQIDVFLRQYSDSESSPEE